MHKHQFFGVLFGALLSTVIYAQDHLSTENASPLLILSSLYTPYGRGVPIPMDVACHSRVLKKCIQGAHLDELGVPVPLGIGSYAAHEFGLLSTVLTTIHQTPTGKETIAALRTFIRDENVLTLTALADRGAFDIPALRTAIQEDFGSMLHTCLKMWHSDCWLVNRSIQRIKEEYIKRSVLNEDQKKSLTSTGYRALCTLIESAQATARQHYLESEGIQRDIFFSGVSYADLARYDLVKIKSIKYDCTVYHAVAPAAACKTSDIISLDGLTFGVCEWDRDQPLWIGRTSVENLPSNCFKGANNVSRILLHNHKIKEIDVGAFESCTRLTALDISHNPIEQLPDKFLVPCQQLVYLNLCDNKIKAISSHTFESKTLRHLVLANNKLPYINADMLIHCPRLSILNVSDNPIPSEVIDTLRAARPDIKIVF